jgi:hypothetical protein
VIRQLFLSDPFASSITISPVLKGDAAPVIAHLRGEFLNCPDSQLFFALNVALLLVIESFVDAVIPRVAGLLTVENAIPLFQSAYDAGADCRIFVDYLADAGKLKPLRALSDEQLDLVLLSPLFWKSPEKVTPRLIERIDFGEKPDHRLAKHLCVARLSLLPCNPNRLRYAFLRYAGLAEV